MGNLGVAVIVHFHQVTNQFYVVGSICGVNNARTGIEVVGALHWVDCIKAFKVLCKINAIEHRFAESFIRYRGIPLNIFAAAVCHIFIKVNMHLVGGSARGALDQIVVERMIFILINGGHLRLSQRHMVNFTVFIQHICHITGFYCFIGNCIEQGTIGVPIQRVLC